jgi:hypothetical protein
MWRNSSTAFHPTSRKAHSVNGHIACDSLWDYWLCSRVTRGMDFEKWMSRARKSFFWASGKIDMILREWFSFKFISCVFFCFVRRARLWCITEQGWERVFVISVDLGGAWNIISSKRCSCLINWRTFGLLKQDSA